MRDSSHSAKYTPHSCSMPILRLPFFSFSFVPHGRPPPFPTVCDIRLFVLLFSSFTPSLHKKNTHSKNCDGEDASSHPTHPWGPTLKKKSVAKAKIFFLLIFRSTQSCCLPSLERPTGGRNNAMSYVNLISQKNSVRRTHLGPS